MISQFTSSSLKEVESSLPAKVWNELPIVMQQFDITTPLRLTHFLAQCAHESEGFTAVEEDLHYRTTTLMKVFTKYFSTYSIASAYSMNPEKIANRVYANRMGNGDEASGDGFKFRGRGYIQTTGKVNYIAFGRFIREDLVANPGLVATKYPLTSAAFYFHDRQIWDICDKGDTHEVIMAVTRVINGGYNHLDERIELFDKYAQLMV